ncbi:hypothetical protein PMAYCL1PPCAC_19796 [Pristionchus mayeri]|uniref:Uncharacterized protein n=1 Tax=Pristionchus mayeri TaxID=1317129 RepID=A0AAN5CS04_9BILA|nr:hypothetical protein PMAYCL1PPCAC_19796 [Pristionchus mayeri]
MPYIYIEGTFDNFPCTVSLDRNVSETEEILNALLIDKKNSSDFKGYGGEGHYAKFTARHRTGMGALHDLERIGWKLASMTISHGEGYIWILHKESA